ncbi:unnamed protein product [Trichogramma brassicae]|uniref:Uncharacterized protein n=1 Tax=Trichogramma brassicae TaxID=86971 RepID=A0A6H5I501_9HYME|nr:unnamed protein product [Trichogramma brassicae]
MNNERDRFRRHERREKEQQYAEQRRLEQRRTEQHAASPKQETVNVTDLVKLLISYEERRDQRLRLIRFHRHWLAYFPVAKNCMDIRVDYPRLSTRIRHGYHANCTDNDSARITHRHHADHAWNKF